MFIQLYFLKLANMNRCFIIHYDDNVSKLAEHLSKQISRVYPNEAIILEYHEKSSDLSEISWRKVKYLVENFDRFRSDKWYITIDCDCAIFNDKKDINAFLNCGKNFLLGSDWNGLCTAAIAIKKSSNFEDIKSLLNAWYFLSNTYDKYEQDLQKGIAKRYEQNSLKFLRDSFPSINNIIGILDEYFMTDNPFKFEDGPLFWHYGAANSIDKKHWILDNLVCKNKNS